jgi:hypothetical protein
VGLLLEGCDEGLVDLLLVLNAVLGGLLLLWYCQGCNMVSEVAQLTSGFSPCLKNASSPAFFSALSLVK